MAWVGDTIASLLNGVSQQLPSLRLPSHLEAQLNMISHPTHGLMRRPGTWNTLTTDPANPIALETRWEMFDRSATEKYGIALCPTKSSSQLRIFKLSKTASSEVTDITYESSAPDYLSSDSPQDELRLVSIGDTTFIVNTTVPVAMLSPSSTARRNAALFWVRASAYSCTYNVVVNSISFSHTTPDGSTYGDADLVKTDYIAEQLRLALVAGLSPSYTVVRSGNVLLVEADAASAINAAATDSAGNNNLVAIGEFVSRFSDLPPVASGGFITKVQGSADSIEDDYYVKFTRNGGGVDMGSGLWEECAAVDIDNSVDPATMPHILEPTGDESTPSFRVRPAEWSSRSAGDEDSAPVPSFVGKTINSLVLFRNRLCLLTPRTLVCSRSGRFYDFWRSTATRVLDDDPIDTPLLHPRVVRVFHACPFDQRLLILGDQGQFIVESGTLPFTVKNVSATFKSSFDVHEDVEPFSVESVVYAWYGEGAVGGFNEFYIEPTTERLDALNVTAHIPTYLYKPTSIAVVNQQKMALFTNANYVHVYKWLWNGPTEKLQSSWSTWKFGSDERQNLGVLASGTDVWFVTLENSDSSMFLYMDLSLTSLDQQSILLDAACAPTRLSFSSVPAESVLSVPLSFEHGIFVDTATLQEATLTPDAWHFIYNKVISSPVTALVYGDPFESTATFSQFFHRTPQGNGSRAVTKTKLKVGRVVVELKRTRHAEVQVTPLYRDTRVKQFGPFTVNLSNPDGSIPARDGSVSSLVQARSNEVTISVTSSTHLPFTIASVAWEGWLETRTQSL